MDQGSNKNHSPAYNFAPTVTKFCVKWEGLSLPHDTKFGNCRCEIVDSRAFPSWFLIHGSSWSGLIKEEPGFIRHYLGMTSLILKWLDQLLSTKHKTIWCYIESFGLTIYIDIYVDFKSSCLTYTCCVKCVSFDSMGLAIAAMRRDRVPSNLLVWMFFFRCYHVWYAYAYIFVYVSSWLARFVSGHSVC